MKKALLLLSMFIAVPTVQAGDYRYLTFETTNGDKISAEISSLTLSINCTTLTVGTESFTLTNLNKMYFSISDETTTGIEAMISDALEEAVEIYDLKGQRISKQQMTNGIYVVKTKKQNYKIVKK